MNISSAVTFQLKVFKIQATWILYMTAIQKKKIKLMKYCTMYKLTSRQNSKEVRADRGRRKYHGNYNNNIKKKKMKN